MPPPAGQSGPAWQLTDPAPDTLVTSRQQILLSVQSAASLHDTTLPAQARPGGWHVAWDGLKSSQQSSVERSHVPLPQTTVPGVHVGPPAGGWQLEPMSPAA
jgi:hypothetical protein